MLIDTKNKKERTPEMEELLEELATDVSRKALEKVKEQAAPIIEAQRKFTPAMGLGEAEKNKHTFTETFKSVVGASSIVPLDSGDKRKYFNGMSDDQIRALAGFAKAVYNREHGLENSEPVRKALGETTGSAGGFLVPYEFRPELLRLVIEDQVVRPRAQVVPMGSDTLIYPRINDTTHASSIHGGIKGTWGAEAGTLGTGDPAFGQLQLIAKKFSDYVTVSNELLKDSPISLAPLLGQLLREGLGFFEDYDMLNATGAGKVKGILQSAALISTTRNTASHIVYDDIRAMQTRLFPSSYKRAVWVCSPGALADLLNLSIAVGTGGSAVMITNIPGQSAADEFPMRIFGRPLIITEKLPDLGTKGDLLLMDPSYYIIGDRMDLTLTSSEHVAFATDQTAFRIIERLDGAPWIISALTPANGGSTLSAFVCIAT